MTRQCERCGFINQDDYDFCAKCGNPLVEGVQPKNFMVVRPEDIKINKKAIAISYIVTIFLSWSGFIVGILAKKHSHGSIYLFRIFHAVLSCPIKTSDNQKTRYNPIDHIIDRCRALILRDASLKKEKRGNYTKINLTFPSKICNGISNTFTPLFIIAVSIASPLDIDPDTLSLPAYP